MPTATETATTIKQRLEMAAKRFPTPEAGFIRRYRNDNVGPYLGEIYVWQTIMKLAERKLKVAWTAAQAEGLVPSDDNMRGRGAGRHIVAESRRFSCIAEVKNAPEKFDLEKYINTLSQRFRLDTDTLLAIAMQSKTESTAPLSKSVLEVEAE